MKITTIVEFKNADAKTVASWLRTNLNLGLKDSLDIAHKNKIDFNGDIENTVDFYEFLLQIRASGKLIITDDFDFSNVPRGSYAIYVKDDK